MKIPEGYKKTEVGIIPKDWEVKPLLSTVHIATGQVDPKIEPYKFMVLVAPDHIESRTGRLIKKVTASEQKAISGKYLFNPKDIVYSKIRPYLRKAILAEFNGLCSADMYPLTPLNDICPAFIFFVLLSDDFSSFTETVSLRSGIPKINREELAEYSIALPPLPEQEAIAQALSDVDAAIAELDRLITKKRNIKQGTMQQLLTGKKRLAGFGENKGYKQTDIGVIPIDWEAALLDSVAKRGSGHTPTKKRPEYWDGNIKWISLRDSDRLDTLYIYDTAAKITPAGIANSSAVLHPADTVVLSRDAGVGKSAITADVMAVSQHFMAWQCGSQLDNHFLYYWLQAAKSEFERIAIGNTIKTIGLAYFKQLKIPFPPLAEQKAIAQILTDMDAEIKALEQKRDKYKAIKQGMMQELLTGRTRLV